MLAIVDEEVGLGALRQRVFARVGVRRPLRHLLSLPRSAAAIAGEGEQRQARRNMLASSGGGNRLGGGVCVVGEDEEEGRGRVRLDRKSTR